MELRHFYSLVLTKVRLNLRSEVSRHQLNYAWWVLEPALFVAVFYLVFGILLQRGGPGFVAFLVCGKIPFLWYSRSVTNASNSIVAGKGLISQVNVPKIFFPLVVMLQDSVKQLFVFALLLVFLVLYGIEPTLFWLYFPLIALTQAVFLLASGLVAACIVPALPDFRFIVSTGMMMLMFGSGIFYSYTDVVLPEHQNYFLMNPLALLITDYRAVLLEAEHPHFARLMVVLLICIVVSFLASMVLKRYHGAYSRMVMQ